ncbi:hypothetical protein EDC04DRAFT_147941 [Pisolithus marmoratus]|nr:hypothetical protein EDC04DRAFT_147941 [Pisolithus marmoratus]
MSHVPFLFFSIHTRAAASKCGGVLACVTRALSPIRGLLMIEPSNRMTLPDVYAHSWCMRPSQLASRGVQALAEQLTQPLRDSGDLTFVDAAVPDSGGGDDDAIMLSAQSQFTQTLLLFSQTQRGRRYTPHLTRFYARQSPDLLLESITASLNSMGVQHKLAPDTEGQVHLRVAGRDARKQTFKGWIDLEQYTYDGCSASFYIMRRDVGCPISWRRFWKELIKSPAVWDHVLKKENADGYCMSIT